MKKSRLQTVYSLEFTDAMFIANFPTINSNVKNLWWTEKIVGEKKSVEQKNGFCQQQQR